MKVISCQSVRHLIYCVLLTAVSSSVEAQSTKMYRVGLLGLSTPFSARREEVRQALRKLRYIEGQNLLIEQRDAERLDQLPQLASDLINHQVDVIVAFGPAAFAAKSVSTVTPIVFIGVQDPVASQLVRSLAAPGGNATGLSNLGSELGEKRLELLKEVSPKSTRIALLFTSSTPEARLELSTQKLAQAFGVQLQSYEVRDPEHFDTAFAAILKNNAQAMLTSAGSIFARYQARIIGFAATNRLPSIYASPRFVDTGGLMSYAPALAYQYIRAAEYVDKILKGVNPGDLPVEQPTKFELVINLKTAKQIGLTIPPNVLARADRVIK